MEINELTDRARKIRAAYHDLEIKQDGQPWTTVLCPVKFTH